MSALPFISPSPAAFGSKLEFHMILTVPRLGCLTGTSLLPSSQPVPQGDLLDDSPLPNCPIRDIVLTERDMQVLPELRRASAMALPRCTVSRYATAWAESLEGAISAHQTWALLCRYCCRLLLSWMGRSVSSSPRCWDSSTQARFAGQNGLSNRRWTNNVGNERAP